MNVRFLKRCQRRTVGRARLGVFTGWGRMQPVTMPARRFCIEGVSDHRGQPEPCWKAFTLPSNKAAAKAALTEHLTNLAIDDKTPAYRLWEKMKSEGKY